MVSARTLLVHRDANYAEWGYSTSVSCRPIADGRGPSMKLGSARGNAARTVQSRWSRPDAGTATAAIQAQTMSRRWPYSFQAPSAGSATQDSWKHGNPARRCRPGRWGESQRGPPRPFRTQRAGNDEPCRAGPFRCGDTGVVPQTVRLCGTTGPAGGLNPAASLSDSWGTLRVYIQYCVKGIGANLLDKRPFDWDRAKALLVEKHGISCNRLVRDNWINFNAIPGLLTEENLNRHLHVSMPK